MTDDSMPGPYARAALAYRSAGWLGVLPLPPGGKFPPPFGWTGGRHAGKWPSGADIQAWLDGPEGFGNIALRLPPNVIGIDVDAYGAKTGAATFAGLEERLGVLSPGPVSTSRNDGVSGIRLFRLPPGVYDGEGCRRKWHDEAGPYVELIRHRHRYLVASPSVVLPKNDGTGVPYWWSEGIIPRPDSLPELSMAWCDWVAPVLAPGESERTVAEEIGEADARAWLAACRVGERCDMVSGVLRGALGRLADRSAGGARHELARDAVRALVAYGGEGHAGVAGPGGAVGVLRLAFLESVRGDRTPDAADGEWRRLLGGAVALARTAHPVPLQECSCRGFGVPDAWLTSQEYASNASPDAGDQGSAPAPVDAAAWLIERMLTPAMMRERPNPVPLVNGILDMNSLAWMIAAPSSYKSFVALDLAAAVGAGRDWFGRRVRQGLSVYLCAEGADGMSLRQRAHEKQYGEMEHVLFLDFPVQAKKPEQWNVWIEACQRLKPALIVIDTQARVTVGMNENDNSEMGVFIDAAEALRRATGACVLIVHHTGRGGGDARGASAIDAAQGTELRVTRTAERRAVVSLDKQKDAADTARIDIELLRIDQGVDPETGRDLSSLVVVEPLAGPSTFAPDWVARLTENQAMVVGVMADLFPERGCTKSEAWAEVRSRQRPGDGTPLVKSSFSRAWDALTGRSEVFTRVRGTQRFVLTSLHSVDDNTGDRVSPTDVIGAMRLSIPDGQSVTSD